MFLTVVVLMTVCAGNLTTRRRDHTACLARNQTTASCIWWAKTCNQTPSIFSVMQLRSWWATKRSAACICLTRLNQATNAGGLRSTHETKHAHYFYQSDFIWPVILASYVTCITAQKYVTCITRIKVTWARVSVSPSTYTSIALF